MRGLALHLPWWFFVCALVFFLVSSLRRRSADRRADSGPPEPPHGTGEDLRRLLRSMELDVESASFRDAIDGWRHQHEGGGLWHSGAFCETGECDRRDAWESLIILEAEKLAEKRLTEAENRIPSEQRKEPG